MSAEPIRALIAAAQAAISTHADELTALDQAIGDGDHGINMRRGFDAVAAAADEIAALPFGKALEKAGMTLVMSVGGASGPLFGSLLMAMGKASGKAAGEADAEAPKSVAEVAALLEAGVAAVKARGKSDIGAKTMIDALAPLQAVLVETAASGGGRAEACAAARRAVDAAAETTREMRATKGRAAFLGERSIGTCRSRARDRPRTDDRHAVCYRTRRAQGRWRHEQCRHRDRFALPGCRPRHGGHGSPDGRRGSAAVALLRRQSGRRARHRCLEAIIGADRQRLVYTPKGVAVLVDLGGAETNSEMAIEMLGGRPRPTRSGSATRRSSKAR